MAYFPCTAGPHIAPGRNSTLYCHQWGSGPQLDFRLRLCSIHLPWFYKDLAKYELVPTDDTASVVDTPTDCFACGQPVAEGDWHFSVTAYPAKNDRKDYWTRLHMNCRMPEWAQGGLPLNQD